MPLSAFTHLESIHAPLTVNHQGQFPVVTVSFNLAPGASLGDGVAAVNQAKQELGLPARAFRPAFKERRRPFRPRWSTNHF